MFTNEHANFWPVNAPPAPSGWYHRAKCAGQTLETVEAFGQTRKQDRAEHLCRGCPVLQECAIDTLHHQDRGIIRAATWIPTWSDSANMPHVIDRLERIAEGTTT